MSNEDERVARLRAELELAELEGELVAAKTNKKIDADKLADIKTQVREARQTYRQAREGGAE